MDSGFCVYGFMAWDELPHAPLPARPRARVSVVRLARTRVDSPGWSSASAGDTHTLGSGRARPAVLPRRARCGAAHLTASIGSGCEARQADVTGPNPCAGGARSGGTRPTAVVFIERNPRCHVCRICRLRVGAPFAVAIRIRQARSPILPDRTETAAARQTLCCSPWSPDENPTRTRRSPLRKVDRREVRPHLYVPAQASVTTLYHQPHPMLPHHQASQVQAHCARGLPLLPSPRRSVSPYPSCPKLLLPQHLLLPSSCVQQQASFTRRMGRGGCRVVSTRPRIVPLTRQQRFRCRVSPEPWLLTATSRVPEHVKRTGVKHPRSVDAPSHTRRRSSLSLSQRAGAALSWVGNRSLDTSALSPHHL